MDYTLNLQPVMGLDDPDFPTRSTSVLLSLLSVMLFNVVFPLRISYYGPMPKQYSYMHITVKKLPKHKSMSIKIILWVVYMGVRRSIRTHLTTGQDFLTLDLPNNSVAQV